MTDPKDTERRTGLAAVYCAWLLACCLLACCLLAGCGGSGPPDALVVSGRIEVDDIHIGSKIGGRVAKVCAVEGDQVKAGAAVVELEDKELVAQLDQAKAATAQAKAGLDLLLAGARKEDVDRARAIVNARKADLELRKKGFRAEEVLEADAQFASAKSELDLAQKEYDRNQALRKSNMIDQSQLDKTRSTYETAIAKQEIAKQRQALVKSGSRPEEIAMSDAQLRQAEAELERLTNGSRPEEIAAQRSALDAAAANVKRLQTQLDETRILAPNDAMVETLDLQVGDLVKPGETVAVLNLKNRPWVRCYVPENRLASVKPGKPVEVTVDSAPGRKLKGVIRRISSEAEFTPRNVQTTEKRSELVFEMKVDVTEGGDILRAGMYADVHVATQ